MKNLVSVVLSLALLTACTSDDEMAREAAQQFLTSYYSMDFGAAEAMCTPECAALIEQGVKDMEELPEYVRMKMKEASEETSFEILAVDVESVEGEAAVTYNLFASGLDRPLEKRLLLKIEGGSALVHAVE